ncbi:MAG: glycosyltransferase family 4 protein [Candidatus Zambryskibacteria bacterium]|nr:glycosyltransferase family 4 protein [Candidatus Zambryskibacteria bacterium]
MKIGIVTTWFERGAAYVSKQYIDSLSKDNEIYIYARGGEKFAEDDENWNKYNVTWGDKKWGKDFSGETREKNLNHFKKWVADNKIEVVFFNEEHWWEPIIFCGTAGIKTGAYVDYYTKETRPFFALYDFLICNTKRHYEAFSWHDQAYYVPWGTDISLFKPQTYEVVDPEFVNFFHSAGMNPFRKGTDLLISAFGKLKTNKVKLIIHTQVDLIVVFPKLASLLQELEKNGSLITITKTVSAPGLYYLGDVYVYPTRLEGIGLTIAEALACGLPTIVPDNGPMNEFVSNDHGRLVKIKKYQRRHDDYFWPECIVDENSLVESLDFFLKQKDLTSWKRKARDYAEKNLDWSVNSKALSEIFCSAIIISPDKKKDILSKVNSYERMKTSKLRRLIHKISIMGLNFIPFFFKYLKKKISPK